MSALIHHLTLDESKLCRCFAVASVKYHLDWDLRASCVKVVRPASARSVRSRTGEKQKRFANPTNRRAEPLHVIMQAVQKHSGWTNQAEQFA